MKMCQMSDTEIQRRKERLAYVEGASHRGTRSQLVHKSVWTLYCGPWRATEGFKQGVLLSMAEHMALKDDSSDSWCEGVAERLDMTETRTCSHEMERKAV